MVDTLKNKTPIGFVGYGVQFKPKYPETNYPSHLHSSDGRSAPANVCTQ